MSSVYVLAPPTTGKVLFRTTCGDLEIELWAKETPKATRNFVQLCMEGYYDGCPFHRIVKDFIVQTGDPSGQGASPYGWLLVRKMTGYQEGKESRSTGSPSQTKSIRGCASTTEALSPWLTEAPK
jgi:cyclophilin family peptidyl-prolyl cis-trans isomerase